MQPARQAFTRESADARRAALIDATAACLAEHGLALAPFVFVTAGLVIGALFVRRQRYLADPMIDLSLFRAPAFGTALGCTVLTIFIAFGFFLFIAQYFQLVLGMTPL